MADRVAYQTRAPATHCRKGHAMEGDNVVVRSDGYRRCRTCLRATKRRWWRNKGARNRAAAKGAK